MKSLYKALAITAAVVMALAATYVALERQPAPQPATAGVVFTAAEPVEISSVAVENATGAYRYYYEGDGYVLDDIPGTVADLDAFIEFMTLCGRLSALRQVAGDASPAEYGLEVPAATVEMAFFDGGTLRLAVGNQERVSGNYYVEVEGFPGVYLMATKMAEPFLRPKTQVVSMLVTPALAVTSPLSAIRDIVFTGGGLTAPVTIQATTGGGEERRLEALSFGTATHLVQGAVTYQLDQTYGVEILGSLFGIQAQEVVDYNLAEADIAALGFDAPWMTVEYDMVGGAEAEVQHMVLQLVRLDDETFYILREGSGAVYQIGRQPFMDIRFDKLPLRWLLTPMLMDLSAVTVEGEGQTWRFDIDHTDARNPVVTCAGQAVDIDLFRALFRLLTSAAHDGNYLGAQPQPVEGDLLSISYEYLDAAKQPDVLALYPGEARRAMVFVNGAGEFAMKDTFAQRVLAGCEDLMAGKPIEENW